jgi:hypothetical protein
MSRQGRTGREEKVVVGERAFLHRTMVSREFLRRP